MKRTTKKQSAELTRGAVITMKITRVMVYAIIIYVAFATVIAR